MLRFVPELKVSWPVDVSVPRDGGVSETESFTAHFVVMSPETALAEGTDMAALQKLLVGWDGVVDGDGQPILFSPENLILVCSLPYMRFAIFNAWNDACAGRAREKN